MNARVKTFLDEDVPGFTQSLEEFSRKVDPGAEPESEALVAELTRRIDASLARCALLEAELAGASSSLKDVQRRFREAIAPWFGQSWFMRRALAKPRGYPGDYELLSAIYDRVPRSRGLGGYLDRYFLNTSLGRAVPARMRSLRAFLLSELERRQGDVSILNVACGSCREYVESFHPTNHRAIRVTCVDNDAEALAFVQSNVGPAIAGHINLELVRYNALRMTSSRSNRERFGRPDIIYSVGLCDYIPDQYLIPMLRGWRESVGEGGMVYVAFKDAALYTTQEYQWLVDWYFFQRTEAECLRLFEQAGYDMDLLDRDRDETGVIINFLARTKTAEALRLDGAEQLPRAPLGEVGAPATSWDPAARR
jgi:hypothetical protein